MTGPVIESREAVVVESLVSVELGLGCGEFLPERREGNFLRFVIVTWFRDAAEENP